MKKIILNGIKRISKTLAVLSLMLMMSLTLSSQTIEEGRNLIKAGKFSEAKPIFARLIKSNPNSATLNQWYGATLFETGEYKEAETYLKKAAAKKIQESYRYLGELYYRTYFFEESVDNFTKYLAFIKNDEKATAEINDKIQRSQLGKRMLDRVEMVQIIDSIIISKKDFLSVYKLGEEAGEISSYNKLFNKKDSLNSTVFTNQRKDKRIFGMKTPDRGYKLVSQIKLIGDNWSKPVELPEIVNTQGNQAFPFMLADGATLYYSSDNGALGGLDLFVTRFNIANNTFLNPEHLGMPFNSIYNDYLMAIDESNHIGWFVSDRFQPKDKVIVYLFIPNEEKKIYKDLDPEKMRCLAQIKSIKDTWGDNKNFDFSFNKIMDKEFNKKSVEVKGDFHLVINDNIIYTRLEDFESEEAKKFFIKYQELDNEINNINIELDAKRMQYNQANSNTKEKISPTILQLETKLLNLAIQPNEYKIKARNTEINYLKTQQKK